MSDLDAYLSPTTLARIETLRADFQAAKPFRHVVIDDFLRAEVAERLLADFPSHPDPSQLVNEFGAPHPKNAVSDVRSISPFYREFDAFIAGQAFRDVIGRITSIEDLEYDPYYFGAGTHENFHGAGLDAHYDFNMHPVMGTHRRLNAIIYLNKDWNPAWRGQICLHTNPYDVRGDEITEIEAIFNRCIIFETTETSWHSVSVVNLPEDKRHLSRKSFTIYMYTRTRPESERAPDHQTVYVQEGLAPEIVAGHTLTQADVDRLVANLERRNEYLKNLYRREYQFSGIIERLTAQVRELRARTAIPLLGAARLVRCEEPPYADGWIGARMKAEVEVLEPARALRFVGWRPAEGATPVAVTVAAGGVAAEGMMDGQTIELEIVPPEPFQGRLSLSVEVSETRPPTDADERELSLIVDRLQFLPVEDAPPASAETGLPEAAAPPDAPDGGGLIRRLFGRGR